MFDQFNPDAEPVYLDQPGNPVLFKFNPNFTSVVVDGSEFDAVLDEMLNHPVTLPPGAVWGEIVGRLRALRNVPAVGRGKLTEWLFERFKVETASMGIMVRGAGKTVAHKLGLLTDPNQN